MRAKLTNNTFIQKAQQIHGNKFDYSLVEYKSSNIKVKIICSIHGIFEQQPSNHLQGKKCNFCAKNTKKNIEDFILEAKKIHNDKYNYDLSNYIDAKTKIVIVCSKHGAFNQRPNAHLSGKGCQSCQESHGERKIKIFLNKNNINFITQHKFINCINPFTNKKLPFDFYLPDYNICIEYDGEQHFKLTNHSKTFNDLKNIKSRDKIKTNFCLTNNIKLFRISYINLKKIENILTKILFNSY